VPPARTYGSFVHANAAVGCGLAVGVGLGLAVGVGTAVAVAAGSVPGEAVEADGELIAGGDAEAWGLPGVAPQAATIDASAMRVTDRVSDPTRTMWSS